MKVVIYSPANLPIPALMGGAIETLTTHLINQNEIYRELQIFVVSPFYKEVSNGLNYNYTNFIFIKKGIWSRVFNYLGFLLYRISGKRIFPKDYLVVKSNKLIKELKPDVIILEGNYSQALSLYNCDCPIIVHLHTDIFNCNTKRASNFYQNISQFWAISKYIRSRISETGFPIEQIKVFKNAIDLSLFQNTLLPSEKSLIRKDYGISDNERVIIYCGRIVPIKGVLELVKAFHKCNLYNTVLLIVGGSKFADSTRSEYEDSIVQYVNLHKLNVKFTGYIPQYQLPKFYSIADISVCPSTCNEAAGLVIIEAMCMGIPVIASKLGGIPEYANDGTVLIEYNSAFIDNLSKAITRLINDQAYYNELKSRCRNNIKQYSLDNYYFNFVKLLREI